MPSRCPGRPGASTSTAWARAAVGLRIDSSSSRPSYSWMFFSRRAFAARTFADRPPSVFRYDSGNAVKGGRDVAPGRPATSRSSIGVRPGHPGSTGWSGPPRSWPGRPPPWPRPALGLMSVRPISRLAISSRLRRGSGRSMGVFPSKASGPSGSGAVRESRQTHFKR